MNLKVIGTFFTGYQVLFFFDKNTGLFSIKLRTFIILKARNNIVYLIHGRHC